ncbi:MAG: histidine kinase dimerization/phosphoacceptor domain -containing protein [Bacteroidota bacterium]
MKFYTLLALTFLFTVNAFTQTVSEENFAQLKQEADTYHARALDIPDEDFAKKTSYLQKAGALYKKAGAYTNEAETLCQLSILYNAVDSIATSISYAQQAVSIKKKHNNNQLFKEYTMLGLNLRVQGKYNDALAYALSAERTIETEDPDKQWIGILYNLIGTIYSELKFYEKSVEYYKKAIVTAEEINDTEGVYSIKINTARGLYNRGKAKEALEILNSGTRYRPGKDCDVEYPTIYILIYCKLKQYNKAKPFYEQLLKCSSGKPKSHMEQEKMYYAMIHYLIQTGQADKTYTYIAELRTLARKNKDLYNFAELEVTHFQADSATGNYLGAIRHLKSYKELNDSLFNISSTKQFADLQLKYETEKKDKNIKLLKQHGQLQETRLNNEIVMRYVFIASLIVLFLILGLLYSRYCIKQRNNIILEAKQEEINRQNIVLRQLVDEKEWLLKEIHHRVKNNLQIVISLLNTQSAYLENEDALLAIKNSQHRMHAMSLIHQKLYQSDNLASIDMSWYIYELVNYLKESFDLDRRINYKLDTDRVDLDVAQAVPLGLILNEAISNAIKYAFPNGQKGQVAIALKNTGGENYQLTIADDGIGLPDGFEDQERESLGMNLMMGLTNQLDGNFKLQNNNGLTIIITFTRKQQLMDAAHNSEI